MNLAGDTFPMSFSSLDQPTTFFESFAPLQWPWITAPELPTSWDEPRRLSISTKQLDAFKFELTSPTQTPTTFHFEAESAEKEVPPEVIDMRDEKLAVLHELASMWAKVSCPCMVSLDILVHLFFHFSATPCPNQNPSLLSWRPKTHST